MKTRPIMIIALMIFISGSIFAQGNSDQKSKTGDRHFMNIPDLTDAQKDQIKEMRTDHMKEVMPLKNDLNEKRARLQTLSTGDNVDLNKVYTAIEEIGKIKIDLAKKRAGFKHGVRNVLTEDQRVYFDMHSGHKHKMHKQGKHMQHKRMQINK